MADNNLLVELMIAVQIYSRRAPREMAYVVIWEGAVKRGLCVCRRQAVVEHM